MRRNNIVKINPETTQKVFAYAEKFYEETRLYVNILGSILPCQLDKEEKIKKGDIFYGRVRFTKNGKIYLKDFERIASVKGMRAYNPKGQHSKGQSEFQHVDAYLVKCKRKLYDYEGLRAGTPEWDRRVREVAELYSAVNGTPLHISKDAPQWYK